MTKASEIPHLDGKYPDAPDWLVGLWRREAILFPDGTGDGFTRCHWGQTRRLYVDLRFPASRPEAAGRASFDEFSIDELRALAEQKGFAGHIVMDDALCSWTRYIDYRPFNGRQDAGRLRIDKDTLYEEGDPDSILASAYQEVYQRERHGNRLCAALRLISHAPSSAATPVAAGAILVLIDDRFLYARPRRQPLPQAETLRELVEAAGSDRALIHAYLDCEISLGTIPEAGKPWIVSQSTLPFKEGMPLWSGTKTRWSASDVTLVQESRMGRGLWRLVESSIPGDRIAKLMDQ